MKKIDSNIDDVFNHIKEIIGDCTDLVTRIINKGKKRIGYFYLQSVSSDDKISNYMLKGIMFNTKTKVLEDFFDTIKNTIPNSSICTVHTYDDIFYYLFSGYTIILEDKNDKVICVETKNKLDRGVEEASTETVIRGPKDSFTENYMTNIGLIRKRIKDQNLWFNELKIGRKTKTKVSICYLKDIVTKDKIEAIEKKLGSIDIDGILDGGYLRDYLCSERRTFFPKIISTERPDYVCSSLLNGKIVILTENTPFALIIPCLFVDFFHTSEDNYEMPLNVTISRIIRFIGFFLTILTPAIYIAMTTYDIKLIPTKLLISLAAQRQGVPFPTSVEVLLLLTTFEILRESDLRSPTQMGSAINIVGALVLGDAAVAAGIVSPIVVIIVAITSVSGLLFSDIDVVNSIRIWRLLFIVYASILGLIGIVAAIIILITRLCSTEVFGIPYMSPISPFILKDQKYGILKLPIPKIKKRPFLLKNKNIVREKSE